VHGINAGSSSDIAAHESLPKPDLYRYLSRSSERKENRLTNIVQHQVGCPCGHKFEARLFTSLNTQLSPEEVEQFLVGKVNRPRCPACGKELWVLIPVLFNDMERKFMVWVGERAETDGLVKAGEHGMPAIICAANYFAALGALTAFRYDPEYAVIPREQMSAAKAQFFIDSYLQLYRRLNAASE
jgi:hypothetical protein